MLEKLKQQVFNANVELVRRGVVIYTWGNVSGIDREKKMVVIKPSGVDYEKMSVKDMVVVDLSGNVIEGDLRPSSDMPTHLAIYREFEQIGGITHTHSVNAVAFAQAGSPIPLLGTTHADYFFGEIPCTRCLTECEVKQDYELNTGLVINETIRDRQIDPLEIPAILVRNHGPFAFGRDANEAVYHAVILETVAKMAMKTLQLNPKASLPQYILDKHYNRKHGKDAYYGQN